MRVKTWRGGFLLGLVATMFLLATACGPGKSASQTAVAETEVQQTAEEATRIAPTNTPIPTETPIPTDTPVPTPTEVKASIQDEEGDCEALTGVVSDEGCQVDLGTFTMLPCENPDLYTFKVGFYSLKDSPTINVCFLIDEDGDPETGFEDLGFFGIDSVYCYVRENSEVILSTYGEDGIQVDVITIANPYSYILSDPEMIAAERHLSMTYPPAEVGSIVIASNARVAAEGLYYDMDGNMVYDGTQPIALFACPVE